MQQEPKGQQPENKIEGSGEKNETVDQPGAQVADYGNVTGGSANASEGVGQGTTSSQQEGEETMGNP